MPRSGTELPGPRPSRSFTALPEEDAPCAASTPGWRQGDTVTPFYDPMRKVIVHDRDPRSAKSAHGGADGGYGSGGASTTNSVLLAAGTVLASGLRGAESIPASSSLARRALSQWGRKRLQMTA